ncbi:alpha/beta fold hydrolase [Hymenobacter sp. BT730]|uniref:alpha/beta fold hydrolase n=1 Tax=Hymenobacter sp. BT730 TaxID=3063332 RepID=UPI0026DFCFFF|nr:alpha/beta fold hydrolase [Hymenobacter sp. BT730]
MGKNRYPSPETALKFLRIQMRLLALVSTELAFRAAWRVFTTPRRLPAKAWEAAALAQARSFQVQSGKYQIAAYEWNAEGSKTVLLVHGWEHRASFWGVFVRSLIKAGYRVVALDGPAHGASSGSQTTLPAFAQAVQTVADQVGPIYAVVAHSFGGAATVGVPVHFNKAADGQLPRLTLLSVPASTSAVAQRFAALLQLPSTVLERMSQYVRQQHGRDAESFSLLQTGRLFPTHRALLLHDHADESIPFAEAQELASRWPGLEFRPTSGLGHNRIMRDPMVIAQILEFLQ